MQFTRPLITGAAGFLGGHLARYLLDKYDALDELIVIDKLGVGGDIENLPFDDSRLKFHLGDLCDIDKVEHAVLGHNPDIIIHLAAESHVDRSISSGVPFMQSNVIGTAQLLEAAKKSESVRRILVMSTDEVLGHLRHGKFFENNPLLPRSPYSASKAAQEHLANAYRITHELPAFIVRCVNIYGPRQGGEKFIPTLIRTALEHGKVPVYGRGEQVREWIYVSDVCSAIDTILKEAIPGDIWHIGSGDERPNLETANCVLEHLGLKPFSRVEFVPDRKGHDFRYSLDASRLTKLGWKPEINFAEGLSRTVKWYEATKKIDYNFSIK